MQDQTPLQQSLQQLEERQQKERNVRQLALRVLVVILVVVVCGKAFMSLRSYRGNTAADPAAVSVQAASQCTELFRGDPGACACSAYANGGPMQYSPEIGCQVWQNGQWVSVTP